MTETTETATAKETKATKSSAPKKTGKTKAATKTKPGKTATPKAERKPKAPRESREGWGTFALKMPVPERESFHKAAGPAGASRFARVVLVAFANEDEAAFKNAIVEARKLRA